MAIAFDEDAQELLDAKNFAVVSTLLPRGGPQTSVVWVKRDGDTVLFTTTSHRQKARNIARDARVSLTVMDNGNPYRSLEIRGTAELIPDPDKRLSWELSHKYLGVDPPGESPDERRFIVRVVPDRVIAFSA
jgi:PPOX class probable F420-dependent enzyme